MRQFKKETRSAKTQKLFHANIQTSKPKTDANINVKRVKQQNKHTQPLDKSL